MSFYFSLSILNARHGWSSGRLVEEGDRLCRWLRPRSQRATTSRSICDLRSVHSPGPYTPSLAFPYPAHSSFQATSSTSPSPQNHTNVRHLPTVTPRSTLLILYMYIYSIQTPRLCIPDVREPRRRTRCHRQLRPQRVTRLSRTREVPEM